MVYLILTKLLIQIDKCMFVDKCMVGGYAAVHQHYAKANNKYLDKQSRDAMDTDGVESVYDSSKETSYIFATDCTNEYGKCMKMLLPYGGFEWIDNVDHFTEDFIKSIPDEGSEGYFIEADLEYPEELHDTHDSYPLGPEKIKVKSHMLSAHQQRLAEKLNIKVGGEKVCLTLSDKTKYACHYR